MGQKARIITQTLAVVIAFSVVLTGVAISDEKARSMPDLSPVQDARAGPTQGAITVGVALGQVATDYFSTGTGGINESAQKDQIRTDLYAGAAGQSAKAEVLNDSMRNYLQDTEQIAQMEAKNAYIRYLNNKSSTVATKAEARVKAKKAVTNYYAKKQKQIAKSWEAEVNQLEYIVSVTSNTSVDQDATHPVKFWDSGTYTAFSNSWANDGSYQLKDFGHTETITLVNQETYNLDTVKFASGANGHALKPGKWRDAVDGYHNGSGVRSSRPSTYADTRVKPPTSLASSSDVKMLEQKNYQSKWYKIEQQANDVEADIDTFINGTYNDYQAGDINNSELVDPYLGAREYEPGESQTWGLRSLLSLGVEPPENASENIGNMTVVINGTEYQGLMMSDDQPKGGYAINKTYNTTNMEGPVFIVGENGSQTDVGDKTEYRIVNATRPNGTSYGDGEKIKYPDTSYKTSNITEYKQVMDELAELRAELEGYRKQSNNDGGAALGGLLPSGLDIGNMELLIGGAVIFGLFLLAGRD
jgi:hypothetical protein